MILTQTGSTVSDTGKENQITITANEKMSDFEIEQAIEMQKPMQHRMEQEERLDVTTKLTVKQS